MRSEKAKTWAATITIFAALLLLYFALRVAPPKVDPRPHEALGQVLANEAGKLAGSGGRITVIVPDTVLHKNPAADVQMKRFYQAVKQAKLTVVATNVIQLDPNRLVRVPPGDFFDVLRKQTDGGVVVSFLGPPVDLSAAQRAKLAGRKPRIVAVCSGTMPQQVNLKELFEQGLLHVAIISRLQPPPNLPQSNNLQYWFDYFYQVITPANLADLPLPAAGSTP